MVMIYLALTAGSSRSDDIEKAGEVMQQQQKMQLSRLRKDILDSRSKHKVDTSLTLAKIATIPEDAMSQSRDVDDDDELQDIKVDTDGIEGGGTDDKEDDGLANIKNADDELTQTITLSTIAGDIHINLRPDLSLPSVEYIQSLLQSPEPCTDCRFYRADKPGILQGELTKKFVNEKPTLGKCPDEYKGKTTTDKTDCPDWDKDCGCHGPVMTRGMVGWAGGGTGPDFFINMYKKKATHWENQHTVWGEVVDEDSLDLIDHIFDLEVKEGGTMRMLKEPLHITMSES